MTVVAEAEGYAPARVQHLAPSSSLSLRQTPGATISGRVFEAGTRRALAGIEVEAVARRNRLDPLAPGAISGELGEFRISGLEPGSYSLEARGDQHRGARRAALELGVAEHIEGIELALAGAAAVSGKVEVL